jgi:hypothetical protein
MHRLLAASLTLALPLALTAMSIRPLAAQAVLVRPSLAGGVGLALRDGSESNLLGLGLAGVEIRRPGSRLSARLNAAYFRRHRHHGDAPNDILRALCGGPVCFEDYRFELAGLAFDGQYDLSRGRVRPYVASGLGTYLATTTRSANYTCAPPPAGGPCAPDPNGGTRFRTRDVVLGLHASLGVSFPVGGTRMFTELRYYSLSPSDQEGWLLPLIVGVRF